MFRPVDISCMTPKGVHLGDTQWMCDAAGNHGFDDPRRVFAALSAGFMPRPQMAEGSSRYFCELDDGRISTVTRERSFAMKRFVEIATLGSLLVLTTFPAAGQPAPNPAMNAPDQLAWQFFIQVNTSAGGNNALFETWASDTDTFRPNPQFPTTAAPLALR